MAFVSAAGALADTTGQPVSVANEQPVETIGVTGQLSSFGATKTDVPIMETARSVSIETEIAFRDKGALTLDDTLNYTAGVVGDTFGFSTRGDFPKVRGLDVPEYRDNLQVLFGFYNNTRSDVYMLEQVEVLKGPASVLYGKGSPGGIVNTISKLAGPGKGSEVVLDVGNHDRYQAAFDYNTGLSDNWYLRVVGLYRESDTQVDYVTDDAAIIMPSVTFQNERSKLTAMLEVSDRNSDTAHQFLPLTGTLNPSATGQEIESSTYLGDPDFNRYDTNSVTFSLLGEHALTEALTLEGITRYKRGEADYRQTWIRFLGAGVPRIDAAGNGQRTWYASDAESEQLAADLRLRWDFMTGSLSHELIVGVAAQEVTTDNDTLYIASSGTLNVFNPVYGNIPAVFTNGTPLTDSPETETQDLGFYLSDQINIGSWYFNAGVRRDEVETRSAGAQPQKDDATSLSAGVLYEFANGLSPYVSYAESFEPVLGRNTVTNEFLKPREGEQMEYGIKYQPPGTATYLTLAYFDIEESNLPNPSALVTSPEKQQEGVAKIKGVELEALTRLGDVSLEANVSILDAEDPNGNPLSSIPEKQVSAWIQYEPSYGPFAGFRAGAGVRYAGENESHSGAVKIKTDGYTVGDLLLGYRVDSWDFSLNLRNITGRDYYGTCLARGDCFPGEGRTAVLRVSKRFP